MRESEANPLLESIGKKREELDKPILNVELLRAQSGSQDPELAEESRKQLRQKWDLDPEKDTQKAETVDMMKQMEKFSEDEKEIMVKNLVGIQLTEGCNGNCPFCLFGIKKGVEAKFSFDSVSTFIREYADSFPEKFSLYWDSDPFDYRDGEHNFTDVYKVWREVNPTEYQYVSTSIPRGGEDDFIDFMRNVASEQKGINDDKTKLPVLIGLSIAEHNIQRIEATLDKLTKTLLEDGYTQKEINTFYFTYLDIAERFKDDVYKVGPLINEQNNIQDIDTPACRDGVLITPKSIKSIIRTIPTVYEPSGQKDVLIEPGNIQIPSISGITYSIYNSPDSLVDITKLGKTMMPTIKTPDGSEYELPNKVDDIVLKLGRETASIGNLVSDFAVLNYIQKADFFEKKGYLNVAIKVFIDRQETTENQLVRAKEFLNSGDLNKDESEKIQFYMLLTEAYLEEMDLLAREVGSNQPIHAISNRAGIFRKGR